MGDRVGEMWIVNSGLKPGERVVSQGTSKIRDGQVVNPQPDTLKAESPYPAAQGENK
jgi:membrane fusion protein (multidrug efflux system)